MFIKQGLFGVILLFIAIAAIPVFALTDSEIQQAIHVALIQRHPTETPEWWRSLGPAAPKIMISEFQKNDSIYQQVRLVDALAWFDDPVATDFLKQQAQETSDEVVRNSAIRSLGLSQGAKELDFIARFLRSPDADTRYTAAQAIQKMDDTKAKRALEQFKSDEKIPWIISKLKGEPLPLPRILAPVASSEDRVDVAFSGVWKGFWITPQAGPSGMVTESAVLHLIASGGGAGDLRGELLLKRGEKIRTVKLGKIQGKNSKITGMTSGPIVTGKSIPSAAEFSFNAELYQEAGTLLLRIQLPKLGGTLILRKEPQ